MPAKKLTWKMMAVVGLVAVFVSAGSLLLLLLHIDLGPGGSRQIFDHVTSRQLDPPILTSLTHPPLGPGE